ncbi:MAG: hypothetical protein IJ418_07260 [Clostridia bacterium]|nr:hypothetical protein [Clostridia bacterium]
MDHGENRLSIYLAEMNEAAKNGIFISLPRSARVCKSRENADSSEVSLAICGEMAENACRTA